MEALNSRLAILLSLDAASASSISDYLLSIDTENDLKEYLKSFLGESPDVDSLTTAFLRHKAGLSPAPPPTKPEVTKPPTDDGDLKPAAKVNPRQRKKEQKEWRQQQSKPKAATELPPGPAHEPTIATTPTQAAPVPAPAPAPAPTLLPITKGTNATPCGCQGMLHKVLSNCLHCGYILCEPEGYSFCPFCSYNVVAASKKGQKGAKTDPAQAHLSRLLQFDRDAASRTTIHDAQADYYSNKSSEWLEKGEREDAASKDEERMKELHERKGGVLDLGKILA